MVNTSPVYPPYTPPPPSSPHHRLLSEKLDIENQLLPLNSAVYFNTEITPTSPNLDTELLLNLAGRLNISLIIVLTVTMELHSEKIYLEMLSCGVLLCIYISNVMRDRRIWTGARSRWIALPPSPGSHLFTITILTVSLHQSRAWLTGWVSQ